MEVLLIPERPQDRPRSPRVTDPRGRGCRPGLKSPGAGRRVRGPFGVDGVGPPATQAVCLRVGLCPAKRTSQG